MLQKKSEFLNSAHAIKKLSGRKTEGQISRPITSVLQDMLAAEPALFAVQNLTKILGNKYVKESTQMCH